MPALALFHCHVKGVLLQQLLLHMQRITLSVTQQHGSAGQCKTAALSQPASQPKPVSLPAGLPVVHQGCGGSPLPATQQASATQELPLGQLPAANGSTGSHPPCTLSNSRRASSAACRCCLQRKSNCTCRGTARASQQDITPAAQTLRRAGAVGAKAMSWPRFPPEVPPILLQILQPRLIQLMGVCCQQLTTVSMQPLCGGKGEWHGSRAWHQQQCIEASNLASRIGTKSVAAGGGELSTRGWLAQQHTQQRQGRATRHGHVRWATPASKHHSFTHPGLQQLSPPLSRPGCPPPGPPTSAGSLHHNHV